MDYRETTWTNFRERGRTFNGDYEKRQKTSANFLNEYLAMGIVWRDYDTGKVYRFLNNMPPMKIVQTYI